MLQRQHCATICKYKKNIIIAYYEGQECTNNQRVVIEIWAGDKLILRNSLYPKTGNCVLAPSNNRLELIYSYFNDTNMDGKVCSINGQVRRWQYCSNWVAEIKSIQLDNTEVVYFNTKALQIQPSIGFLTRCNPITVDNERILPLYHEKYAYGRIMKQSNYSDWYTCGDIGMNNPRGFRMIQPTLWCDGSLHSLSRNFSNEKSFAIYSRSVDMGHTWSEPKLSEIDNHNNSLVVAHDSTSNPWVIWNYGYRRNNLVLGKLDGLKAVPLLKLNKTINGSYPNYCWDKGDLHIVHTDGVKIVHHKFSRSELSSLEGSKPIF